MSPIPAKNEDLHGNVPDTSPVALLLIDVINDMEFPGGAELFEHSMEIAPRIAALKRRAKELGIPVVYVNDNFGKWQSDRQELLRHCLEDGVRGGPFVEQLMPDEDDYFVLKPKHSGFYSTTLETLLAYLRARTVILTGVAGNNCVLFTANDAFMRDLHVVVPSDCVASIDPDDNAHALRQMRDVLHAEIPPSTELDLEGMVRGGAATGRPGAS
jgi:nicotinamidase-related amidase